MRCRFCDCLLTDKESTAKGEDGHYLDICADCLAMDLDMGEEVIDTIPYEEWEENLV
jgi:hypothetical protein